MASRTTRKASTAWQDKELEEATATGRRGRRSSCRPPSTWSRAGVAKARIAAARKQLQAGAERARHRRGRHRRDQGEDQSSSRNWSSAQGGRPAHRGAAGRCPRSRRSPRAQLALKMADTVEASKYAPGRVRAGAGDAWTKPPPALKVKNRDRRLGLGRGWRMPGPTPPTRRRAPLPAGARDLHPAGAETRRCRRTPQPSAASR